MTHEELINDSDFRRISSSDFQNGAKAEVFYNSMEVIYYIIVDDNISCGPISRLQFEALLHAGKDAFEDSRPI